MSAPIDVLLAQIEADYDREGDANLAAFQRDEIDFGTWRKRHNDNCARRSEARRTALARIGGAQ